MTKKETTPNPEDNSGLDPEDELISSTSLCAKCDLEVLPIALKIGKNRRKNLILRRHALKILLKNKSIYPDFFKNRSVKSDLKDISLESFEIEEKSPQHFHLKRYAFQCLKFAENDLSDDFYETYHLHLKKRISHKKNTSRSSALRELEKYIIASAKSEKFRILEALSVALSESSCGLKTSIFTDFSASFWAKESLIFALLSNNRSWDVEQAPRFVEKINALDDFMKEKKSRHSIEEVLKILIETQKECHLDIGFINNILTSVGHDIECLDVLTKDFSSLPNLLEDFSTLRLRNLCDRQKIGNAEGKELTKLNRLLVHSGKAIASIFDNVKPETPITDLISFLQLLNNSDLGAFRKELFLLELLPNESIDDWKTKLYLQFIESEIRREFPNYKSFSLELSASPIDERNVDRQYFLPIASTDEKKHTKYWQCRESSKSNLNKSLDSAEKKRKIGKIFKDLQKKVSKIVLKSGWAKSRRVVETLIKCLDGEDKIVQLTNSLEILLEYEIDITDEKICEIFSRSNAIDLQKNIHRFAVERAFPGTYEKSFDRLTKELEELNESEEIGSTKIKELSMSKYNEVMSSYSSKSELFPDSGSINTWTKKDVARWVEKLAGHPQRSRAKEEEPLSSLINGFLFADPRESFKKRRPDIFQDPFGSLINGFQKNPSEIPEKRARNQSPAEPGSDVRDSERIAVIKRAMELVSGFPIRDIQLLSVVLLLNSEEAKGRLAQINTGEGKTMIIAMMAAYHASKGSKVDVITSSPLLAKPQSEQQRPFYSALGLTVSHNVENHTEGYEADVVYGTSQAFQGDILRDEFRKRDTRHGRRCDIAIVDEVDNMLVDGNNYIVMLSCEMPAMDHLEGILATIFIQVTHAAKAIVQEDGQAYFVDSENAFDEKGQVREEVVQNRYPLDCSIKDFITNCTEKHVRNLIRDTPVEDASLPELKIPKHLRELVCKAQLKKWIGRAIAARLAYVKNEDYILRDGDVKIVDAANTGVVRMNSQWSNGLHQFLQIKHGVKITPESLTTNFISNVSFFKRYPPKLYGLTGTLGTNGTKELLSKTYGVDSVVVPPFKWKQHRELAAIIVDNKDDWYTEVAKSCLRKLTNGRAVLIIMEYIGETEEMEKTFKDYFRYESSMIKLYKTDVDAAVVDQELKSGHVIITTNIAGRGTDIKLSKDINVNGGLHVCITFLPKNSRVELQNMGRTSRTGNRGTSQFVLCKSGAANIEEMKANRAKKEKEAMERADREIATVTTKDTIFQEFCKLMGGIKGRNGKKREESFAKEVEKEAVEERFAIWLEINEDNIDDEPREKVLADFATFVEEIKQDDRDDVLIKNPYMHVKIGNKYLNRKRYKEAIKEYTLAIKLDDNYAEHARYNRGYAYIAKYGSDLNANIGYIKKAAKDFRVARKLIEERQCDLNLVQTASDGEVFSEQVRHKLNLYNVQKNAIDIAIGPDVKALDLQIEHLEEQKKSDKLTPEDKAKITESIGNLKKNKEIVGVIYKAKSKGSDLEIELKDLKESLPDDDWKSHESEIEEFERNGFIGDFQISQIPPIDWSAVIGLLLLGFAQLVGGAALAIFTLGAGSSFAMGLISEGISDIITAVKDGIINRSFDWATWAIEKAISITVSVVCAGLSAIKNCARSAYAGAKMAASSVGKGAGIAIRSGWKIVAKRVGFELAKGIGKEIAKDLINYGVDQTLVPCIEQEIVDRIKGPIEEALIGNPMVKKMLELDDKVNKDHYYENRIIAMGCEILNPQTNAGLKKIALEVASRVANNKVKHLAVARQVYGAVEALWDLGNFTKNFVEQLNKAISEEARKKKIDEKSVGTIVKEREQGETMKEGYSKMEDGEEIDVSRAHVEEEQVKLEEREPRSSKAISKQFVKIASTNMLGIIKGKIIAPVVNFGVDYGMDKITSSIQHSIEHDTQIFKSHMRVLRHQDEGYKDPKKKEIVAFRTNREREEAMAKVDEMIDGARAGDPSGLVFLGAASDALNCPIKVFNEKQQLMYTIGSGKSGKPVDMQYYEAKDGEEVGHYTKLGGKEPTNRSADRNMCMWDVLGEAAGKNPNFLKESSLSIISNNKEYFAKQSSDIAHLEMYSRMKLASGGARFDPKNPDEATDYLTNSDGTLGFLHYHTDKPRKAHPGEHIPYRRSTRDLLEATSAETKQNIEIYDDNRNLAETVGKEITGNQAKTVGNEIPGNQAKTVGNEVPGNLAETVGKKISEGPIKLNYHKPEGDTSGEYFTSKDGPEKSRLHDPTSMDYWNTISEQTGDDPKALKAAVTARMDAKTIPTIPIPTTCIERASKRRGTKAGFYSKADAGFVAYYVKDVQEVKDAVAKMNEYEPGVKDTKEYACAELTIDAEKLNMPRQAYGATWVKGQMTDVWPITGPVEIKIQHFKGKETDRDAPVQIQTFFPRPPPESEYLPKDDVASDDTKKKL